MAEKPLIVVTNDDGIFSKGIKVCADKIYIIASI